MINEDYVRREIEILYNNRKQKNDDLMIVERERERRTMIVDNVNDYR